MASRVGDADFEQEIYEAAVLPERWPAVLDRLSKESGAVGAVLFSNTDRSSRWLTSPGIRAQAEKFVAEGWPARNSRAAQGFLKGLDMLPRFTTEADLYDSDEYERDPIYVEYFRPNGMGWSAGTLVWLPHGDVLTLSLERAYELGPMPAIALNYLDDLRPHLARSAMLAARLSFERARTAIETLSALGLAACAVTSVGRITVDNREFRAEEGFWTNRGGDRIALHDRRADRQLHLALETIESNCGVRSIPLRAAVSNDAAVLHVVPIRRSAHDLFNAAAAILVATKMANRQIRQIPLLQALFDLTAAEANLSARIAVGETVQQIAAKDGKSVATVRNQLASVLEKTGCRRQVDLARVLAYLLPPSG